MRKTMILCTLPLLVLAACHAKVDVSESDDNSSDGNVHVAMHDGGNSSNVSVNVPGFNANVSLPSLNIGSHVDLDGIKLAPDTKVGGFDVDAQDKDGTKDDSGIVRVRFTNPQAPAAVIDHYAKSAVDAGYGDIVKTGSSLAAKKDDKTFALDIAPDGAGSKGTITISGKN
jgi:hypothetical protein